MGDFTQSSRMRIVINADDCGYLPNVTLGIADCIEAGSVTATSIIANGEGVGEAFRMLTAFGERVDCGVHLNLSFGTPMSPKLGKRYTYLPGGLVLLRDIARKRIQWQDIHEEWTLQIEYIKRSGLPIIFLNTHEHVDLLPPFRFLLYRIAREYNIRWTRRLRPEWKQCRNLKDIIRHSIVQSFSPTQKNSPTLQTLNCFGFGLSGRLNIEWFKTWAHSVIARLPKESAIELMCHPGHKTDSVSIPNKIRNYHAWHIEHAMLTNPAFFAICQEYKLIPSRYRDL